MRVKYSRLKVIHQSSVPIKTTKADFEKAAENKKEVRFGKSTTYQVPMGDHEAGGYNTADMDKDGRGSPRPGKKVI